ncbi:uncharacterized protein [Halyomorpha halys]|uniref:uncharacterized protein n=1 Tax=Halyomorpha halys TaxID=286706 RepID=UPI0034D23441
MQNGVVLLFLSLLSAALAQVFLPVSLTAPPVGGENVFFRQSASLAHRDVLINAEAESHLPPQLTNPFYRNPRIADALAKESWFGPGEMHVSMRETSKIPRGKIFSVLKNAGLARRRR